MEQSVTECRREMERLFGERDDLVRELRYMESQMQVGVPVEQLFGISDSAPVWKKSATLGISF